MKVLAPKTPSFVISCPACDALLGFNFGDIYENRYVYCPVCREKILTKIDLGYNGVVRMDDGATSGEK